MLHTYTAELCMRKCDVTTCADDVIDNAVNIKDDTTLCRCLKIYEEIDGSSLLDLSRVKAKLMGIKNYRFCFLYIQNISWSPEDPKARGALPAIFDFPTDCFSF